MKVLYAVLRIVYIQSLSRTRLCDFLSTNQTGESLVILNCRYVLHWQDPLNNTRQGGWGGGRVERGLCHDKLKYLA
jgi:hypothetical protein